MIIEINRDECILLTHWTLLKSSKLIFTNIEKEKQYIKKKGDYWTILLIKVILPYSKTKKIRRNKKKIVC